MGNEYVIAETYTLPSQAKLYKQGVSSIVKMRSMTTEHEQQRTSKTDYPYKMLSDIIDDCIVDPIGMSAYDMHIGDYQFLLHKLRSVTYGSQYKMNTRCKHCGCVTPETVDLDTLPIIPYTDDILKYFEFDLPVLKDHIRIRFQTPRSLDAIKHQVLEYKRKGGTKDPTLTYTLVSLIESVNGNKLDVIQLEDYVANMPMMDTNTIISYSEKLNNSIGVDTELIITCNICHGEYRTLLAMTPEFFRPALDI